MRRVSVSGNLKFDVLLPTEKQVLGGQWREALGERSVWLAASTRESEEDLVLDAWQAAGGDALLVLVPRHPQRFDAVAALLKRRGIAFQRRSSGLPTEQALSLIHI